MKYFYRISQAVLLAVLILSPLAVFAQEKNQICSPKGYTLLTINGILTSKEAAAENKRALERKLSNLANKYNGENLNIDFLHNPSHIGGIGDIAKAILQGVFDSDEVKDHDLVKMLKDASQKVTTQKLLLVAHSQGNFYANSFFDTVTQQPGGVPKESIGVYSVATPSGRVAGRVEVKDAYITSETDKIIAKIVGRVPFRKILETNTHIDLQSGDDWWGHSFSEVYLKHKRDTIISNIQSSLATLSADSSRDPSKPCIAPPPPTPVHQAKELAFAVLDPAAQVGLQTVFAPVTNVYRGGKIVVKNATPVAKKVAAVAHTVAQKTANAVVDVAQKTKKAATDLAHTASRAATTALAKVFPSPTRATQTPTVLGDQTKPLAVAVAPPPPAPQPPKKKPLAAKPKPKPKPRAPTVTGDLPIIFPGYPTEPAETTKPQGGPASPDASQGGPEPEQVAKNIPLASIQPKPASSGGGGSAWSSNPAPAPAPSPAPAPAPPPVSPPAPTPTVLPSPPTTSSTSFFLPAQGSLSLPTSSSTPSSTPQQEPTPGAPSTPPEAFFTVADAVPDTFIIDLAWYASSTATSTPLFDVEVSWDGRATWLTLASSTPSTSLQYETTEGGDPIFRVRATDASGQSLWTVHGLAVPFVSYPKDVVINELAPWGTPGNPEDEWIELYNSTGHPIDLTGWTLTNLDGSFAVTLTGTINPYNYFLLEQGDENTLTNIPQDQIFFGNLNDAGEDLYLLDASDVIVDRLTFAHGWPAADGAEFSPIIMRVISSNPGSSDANWTNTFEGFVAYAKNRDSDLVPGAPARVNHAVLRLEGTLMVNFVLTAEAGPYEVTNLHIGDGAILFINPGAVLRFTQKNYETRGITVESGGILSAEGTEVRPVVFTKSNDNYYERSDPLRPQTATTGESDWGRITFATGSSGVIDHAVLSYMQFGWPTTTMVINADAVIIKNTTISRKGEGGILVDRASPTFEDSELPGIKVTDGSPTVTGSELKGGNFGMWVERGAPTVKDNTLVGSRGGLRLIDAAPTLEGNIMQSPRDIFMSGTIPGDLTLTREYTWIVDGAVRVPQGVIMTIQAGTRIEVNDDTRGEEQIVIEGAMKSLGTAEAPVLITALYDPLAVDDERFFRPSLWGHTYSWGGIKFQNIIQDSLLAHTVIRYAGNLPYSRSDGGKLENSVRVVGGSGGVTLDSVEILTAWLGDPQAGYIPTGLRVEGGQVVVQGGRFREAHVGANIRAGSVVQFDRTQFKNMIYGIFSVPEASTTLTGMTRDNFVNVRTPIEPTSLLP